MTIDSYVPIYRRLFDALRGNIRSSLLVGVLIPTSLIMLSASAVHAKRLATGAIDEAPQALQPILRVSSRLSANRTSAQAKREKHGRASQEPRLIERNRARPGVTIYSRRELDRQGIRSLDDLFRQVPNIKRGGRLRAR